MPNRIDYYMSLLSPWTYLGDARLIEIAAKHGAEINIKPTNLGRVFPETGGLPLAKRAPARRAYRMQELKRWHDFLGVPINYEPAFFPTNEWPAAGVVIAAKRQGIDCHPLLKGFLTAVWAEERNIADRGTILAIAKECSFNGPALLDEAENDPDIEAIWVSNSNDALEAGVFGAPSYIIGDQLFWGQDRLEFIDRALADE